MAEAIPIERLLREAGYDTPAAQQAARAVLEARRLTRPGKQSIDAAKRPAVQAALADTLAPSCADAECAAGAAAPGRTPVTVSAGACPMCAGSDNQRAALSLVDRMRAAGRSRLLIVGGTPEQHRQLDRLLSPHGIRLRCIDAATGSYALRDAQPDMNWAEIIVIWGGTPLPHKVSHLYDAPPAGVHRVTVDRRGIKMLCRAVVRSLS